MSEAWQVRGCQRQHLIEELTRKVYERADEVDNQFFYLEIVLVIIEYLKNRQKGISNPKINEKNAVGFFLGFNVMPTINNFARTEAEGNVLFADFLEKVLASVLSPFRSELQKQEMLLQFQIHLLQLMAILKLQVQVVLLK